MVQPVPGLVITVKLPVYQKYPRKIIFGSASFVFAVPTGGFISDEGGRRTVIHII
jgi:hypothetical protein